jgi:hypothetical protein
MRGRSPARCQAASVSTTAVGDAWSAGARCAGAGFGWVGGPRAYPRDFFQGVRQNRPRALRERAGRGIAGLFRGAGRQVAQLRQPEWNAQAQALNGQVRRTVGQLRRQRLHQPLGQALRHLRHQPARVRAPAPASVAQHAQAAVADADRVHVRTFSRRFA